MFRTKSLVLELLAAVCLVRGGHDIILRAFNNFKEVCREKSRFSKLMNYFKSETENIEFMVITGLTLIFWRLLDVTNYLVNSITVI